jgi:glycosyltransferase involved in cell wall biosynthesis
MGVREEKILVVYPGVAQSFLTERSPEEIRQVKLKYGLPSKYVLSVGTLEPRKNIPTLLKAFAENRSFFRDEGCKLVLVGMKGWMYDDIFKTIHECTLEEDSILTGYVDDEDLPSIYQGAELFIFPSFYEGFGIPLLEAMASSIPVVASDIGAHREVLHDAAWFFDPHDVDGLAQSMRDLYQDQDTQDRLIAKGLQQVSLFNWQASASQVVAIYEQCAQEGR